MKNVSFSLARTLEHRWKRVADDARPLGTADRALQTILSFASPVYRMAAVFHRGFFQLGFSTVHRLDLPVVSIGNLTLGGTGKTPVVQWLARQLLASGFRPAVLSRGYGGRAETMKTISALVTGDGHRVLFPAQIAGDEPVELGMSLPGIPVVVGRKRMDAACLARDQFHPDLLLLDDGFQHYALARQCDLVVLDATRPPRRLRGFPRGSLRESPRALHRAHAVILTRCDQAPPGDVAELRNWLGRRFPKLLVVPTRLRSRGLATLEGDVRFAPAAVSGKKAYCFCGLGRPESFAASLEELDLRIVGSQILADHVALTPAVLAQCRAEAEGLGAELLICSRKDAVKLAAQRRHHPRLPVLVLETEIVCLDPEDEIRLMQRIVSLCFPEGSGKDSRPPRASG